MKAVVTGGTGFLGSRIVQMLRERGDEVTVLARQRTHVDHAPNIPYIRVDIADPAAVTEAFRTLDADVVLHVAAKTGIWGPKAEYRRANVDGTRHVIQACREQRITRLVYTSTPSVVFGRDELCGVDESQPYPDRFLCAYAETKAQAEQMVLAANGPELATVALRPHLIWGPGDPHLIERISARARAGKLVQVGNGTNQVDVTFVDNAAQAHLAAADHLAIGAACAGRAYFITNGEPVQLWPWLNKLLAAIGVPTVARRIGFRTAYALGTTFELFHRLLRIEREPQMTRFLALQLAKSHYFDISAARRDLEYAPRISLDVGLGRLAESLQR